MQNNIEHFIFSIALEVLNSVQSASVISLMYI